MTPQERAALTKLLHVIDRMRLDSSPHLRALKDGRDEFEQIVGQPEQDLTPIESFIARIEE